jgi:colicin import membrane protein
MKLATAAISLTFLLSLPAKADTVAHYCEYKGQKYLVGQRILMTDVDSKDAAWMICSYRPNNGGHRPGWSNASAAGQRDDLLEQARRKAIAMHKQRQQIRQQEMKASITQTPAASVKKITRSVPVVAKQSISLEESQRVYLQKILSKVRRNWTEPNNAGSKPNCEVKLLQGFNGRLKDVKLKNCPGTRQYRLSVEEAVLKSQPLPLPEIPELYKPDLTIVFSP